MSDAPQFQSQHDNSPNQARVSQNENSQNEPSEEFRVRVSSDDNSTVDRSESENERTDKKHDTDKFSGSDSKSLLIEFDEYVASERNIEVDTDLGYGFEVGDLVWGKVKSHPWWPGHIYNEAFASPSVRRARTEGHVLVAFFGDSSYGWFEPAELIPFEANFAEKSQQTFSRTFVKAVEEAVDEASRRRGLGLACKCRNPNNFRSTKVPGYYSVDVMDYEPGGFYSDSQIKKARDSFNPIETLDFVRELAFAPLDGDHGSIDFVENKATVCAYRKAVFEQYDETYAQAFGVQRPRPSRPQNVPHSQSPRQPPKAPLSGPLVIAETLGGGKSGTKSAKFKENSKKDRYLFKRRDDAGYSSQLTKKEAIPDAAGHYVFQNRAPPLPVIPRSLENHADSRFVSHDGATSTSDAKEAPIGQVQAENSSLAPQAISFDAKPHLETGKIASSEEMAHSLEQDTISSKNMARSDLSGELPLQSTDLESKVHVNAKHDRTAKLLEPCEDFKQSEQGLPTVADGGNDTHQVKSENNSPVEAKHRKISAVKKIKGLKRPADDLNSKASVIEERKKKRKKNLNLQPTSDHLEKHFTSGKSVHHSGNLTGKPLPPREGIQSEQMQVDFSARNLLHVDTLGDVNLEVPQLLGDLQALALNPFHGIERKIPVAARQFFLRFRSLVYQKSLASSPPRENEAQEVRVAKSPDVRISDNLEDHVRASPLVKPVKHVRPDDPAKAGRKRGPSDRQEDIAAKRLKKIKDIKALAADKTAANQKTSETRREDKAASSQKTSEARREDGREPVSQAPSKLMRPDSAKKVDRPSKTVQPTTLVIKFPPQTSLPSVAELKARFARFGPMDQSGFRIFWKSSTCRVVFLYKADAQAAYRFSAANPSLFGSTGVRCFLREFGDSASEASEATKVRGDDGANETPRVKDPAVVQQQTPASSQKPLLPLPTVQLKSCLKKSNGDESGQGTGNGSSSKGNPRVKFMLVGEESSRGEPLIVGNKNNNANLSDAGAPIAMDFISKNIQKVSTTTSSQPPLLPTPQFLKTPQHNLRNSELAMASRNNPNFINTTTASAAATATSVDISHQMITLLTRCSDVVTNLTGILGYVPYHPL
ncbi:PWWP domain-containing protein 1-like [Trifolium pratense]|uniref:PWWP domain-containing protein 1-like n=1 Tax=Trifolium pratense TaxID=57577 RepID=UPI001E6978F8|nr:PWWP domain-containing protein 1-like [Trifolium pratense]